MQSRIPVSLRVNTDLAQPQQRMQLPAGKARDLIKSNRVSPHSAKVFTRHASTPVSVKTPQSTRASQSISTSRKSSQSIPSNTKKPPKSPAPHFKNSQIAASYKSSPYIKGTLANRQSTTYTADTPKVPMKARSRATTNSQMQKSVSTHSPLVPGPPIRRLPSSKAASSPIPVILQTEKLKQLKPKTPANTSSNASPAPSHHGYAVGLYSNTSTKLNELLLKDINDLDIQIFSLLVKHEALFAQNHSAVSTVISAAPEAIHVPSKPLEKSEEGSTDSTVSADRKKFPFLKAGVKSPKLTPKLTPASPPTKPSLFTKLTSKIHIKPAESTHAHDIKEDPGSPLIPIPHKLVFNKPTSTPHSIPPTSPHTPHQKLTTSNHIPEHLPSSQTNLTPCPHCARTFSQDRLASHQKVCKSTQKAAQTREKRRNVSDAKKNKEEAMKEKIRERENFGKVGRAKVDWHELIGNVRAAKEYQREVDAKK